MEYSEQYLEEVQRPRGCNSKGEEKSSFVMD
jgi:hypothetical protein